MAGKRDVKMLRDPILVAWTGTGAQIRWMDDSRPLNCFCLAPPHPWKLDRGPHLSRFGPVQAFASRASFPSARPGTGMRHSARDRSVLACLECA